MVKNVKKLLERLISSYRLIYRHFSVFKLLLTDVYTDTHKNECFIRIDEFLILWLKAIFIYDKRLRKLI